MCLCDSFRNSLTRNLLMACSEQCRNHYVVYDQGLHYTDKLTEWHIKIRLAPVLKTTFHQSVISYTCSQSYSDGSVLKQSHHSKTSYKYMV